jgi:hypothetical protein
MTFYHKLLQTCSSTKLAGQRIDSWPVKEHRAYNFETWYMYASTLNCTYHFTLKETFCLFYKNNLDYHLHLFPFFVKSCKHSMVELRSTKPPNFGKSIFKNQDVNLRKLAAWSNGIVSSCHRGGWSLEVESRPGLPDGIFSNQKIQIWVNFGGSRNGRCWYILWPFGLF